MAISIEEQPYSTPWIRKYRSEVFKIMEGLSRDPLSSTLIKAKKRIKKLYKELLELERHLKTDCPHPIDSLRYSEGSREDTLGRLRQGRDYSILCDFCGKYLKNWSD